MGMNTTNNGQLSIIVDLDDTLTDASHRKHLAEQKDWDYFHSLCADDAANLDIIGMLDCFEGKYGIIILTGRPEKHRATTIDWLHRFVVKYDLLIMRGDDDKTPTDEFKIKALEHWMGGKQGVLDKVAFCLEDRDKNVKAFREYGLRCLQVREGNY